MEILKHKNDYIEKVNNINSEKVLKYYILTMGCKLNENDSEKICGMAEEMNYVRTEDMEESDLIIFNTCCIRENAEDKLFGKLGAVKEIKKKRGTIIAIGGCMMQQEHITDKINKSYSFYDIIFGTHTLHKFPEDLYHVLINNKRIQDIQDIDGEIYEEIPIKREDKTRACVTIMYGCNNFCTYCIVPYVRGRERSRDPKDILEEVKTLVKEGYKEITYLGQNVNSYKGNGNCGIHHFSDLLIATNQIEGIERIRFISPHPKDFTDDVIKAIKECDKVSKSIHLPLQSGSTNVLKRMNRNYTKEKYLELVKKIKREILDVTFTTDIIVGFPGETKQDFEDTLDVIRKVKYEQVYMFIYSRRKNTPADNMEDQVAEDIKHERFERLKELVKAQIQQDNKSYIGRVEYILVEGFSKNNPNMLTGRTNNNKIIIFEGNEQRIDKMIPVKIVSEHLWYLKGEEVIEIS